MRVGAQALRRGCLWALLVVFSAGVQAQEAVDPHQKQLAMQLITDSYMLRFYSYLGDDYFNYAGSDGVNEHREGAEKAVQALLAASNSAELARAWEAYNQGLNAFVANWKQQQYPDWYSLEAFDQSHRSLVELLDRHYGGGEPFAVNLELMDVMEFYMFRNTEVSLTNPNPRGVHYDMARQALALEKRLMPLVESHAIEDFSGVRWKYIKTLFENHQLNSAPMTLLRHGGGLAESLGAG